MTQPPSLVWLPADHRLMGDGPHTMPFLVLGDKYARAVTEHVQAQPVLFPLAAASQIDSLLSLVDGVMLTGSPSNVHPSHFGDALQRPDTKLDAQRDALTLELVRACVKGGVPLLGICRGFQEINVALGGSLHQEVHAQSGLADHREDYDAPYDLRYAPVHRVHLAQGSCLQEWAGASTAMVNSLHGQGIARLAQGLRALAHADDGLVEAFEVEGAPAFALGVQWHPEWKPAEHAFYAATLNAFGRACRARHAARKA